MSSYSQLNKTNIIFLRTLTVYMIFKAPVSVRKSFREGLLTPCPIDPWLQVRICLSNVRTRSFMKNTY